MASRTRSFATILFLSLSTGVWAEKGVEGWCSINDVDTFCGNGCCQDDTLYYCCPTNDTGTLAAAIGGGLGGSFLLVFLAACWGIYRRKRFLSRQQAMVLVRQNVIVSTVQNTAQPGGAADARPPEHAGYDQPIVQPPAYSPPTAPQTPPPYSVSGTLAT